MHKISIIIPSFNQGRFLSECFDGIVNQNGDIHKEIIVVDNESTDCTKDIVEEYKYTYSANKKNDFIFIREKDKGGMDAWNKGVKIATGDYVGFCNTSDYYYNLNWFDQCIKVMENNIWVSAVYGMTFKKDESDYCHGVGGYRLIGLFENEQKVDASILGLLNHNASWNESTAIFRKEVANFMIPFELNDCGAILTAQRKFNFEGYASWFIQKIASVTYIHEDSFTNKNDSLEPAMWKKHNDAIAKFKERLSGENSKYFVRDYTGKVFQEINLKHKSIKR